MRVKNVIVVVVVITLFYITLSYASVGRFNQTHSIVAESTCISCHIDELIELNSSQHIYRMEKESIVIDSYVLNYDADINGLCYSCHNLRVWDFGFVDPYISGNTTAINGIVNWYPEIENGLPDQTVSVDVTLASVLPNTSSVVIEVAIEFMNFADHQDIYNTTNTVFRSIQEGETINVQINNVYGDYYKVYVSTIGNTTSSSLIVSIPDQPDLYIYSIGTNYYLLPNDFPLQYSWREYFHTNGSYTVKRMDNTFALMRANHTTKISSNEMMYDNFTNTSRYTCAAPDTMCHINQKITSMGLKNENLGEKYYLHEMSYATGTCDYCHFN
ncbi:MAG: hypothetical protein M8350_08560 [Methanosarcinaceae archaeon]|nr:hypothetical protein [Methanosarcinaceae archaeon]